MIHSISVQIHDLSEQIAAKTEGFSGSELAALAVFVESRLLIPIFARILRQAGQPESMIQGVTRITRALLSGLGLGLSSMPDYSEPLGGENGDHLIPLEECARILGFDEDTRWLREHEGELSFIVRLSRKEARASWNGLQAYLRSLNRESDRDPGGVP